MDLGALVTYDDENPLAPEVIGRIAEPTAEELAHAAGQDEFGPNVGDVLVHWDDDEDPVLARSWVHPRDLIVLDVSG